MIYLDNAATSSLSPHVKNILLERYSLLFGNSSSPHVAGLISNKALENARSKIGNIFNIDSSGIYFTSGATESINLLLQGYLKFLKNGTSDRNEIVISQIEHPAVYKTVQYLAMQGFVMRELKNNRYGQIDIEDLSNKVNAKTALVAVMAVNNETGVLQDIGKLVDVVKIKNRKTLFFSDTVQALGKINVNSFIQKVDSFCFSAHKIGGPKGTGFLFLNPEFHLLPLMYGGDQELSYRPGTTNVPSIDLMVEALEDRIINFDENFKKVTELNQYLSEKLAQSGIIFSRIVPTEYSSPYIFCLSLQINNDKLLEQLSKRDICVSKRSACSSQSHTKSRILESMNISHDEIDRIIRISFSPETTKSEIDIFLQNLREILA